VGCRVAAAVAVAAATAAAAAAGDVARRTVQIILKPPEHSKTTRTF